MSTSAYRLPSHASPRRYDVQLDARLGRAEFTGRVAILLDLHLASDVLELHARNLTIISSQLWVGGQALEAKAEDDPENEKIVFRFVQAIPAGVAELIITFTGRVSQSLKGLYLSQNPPEQVLCTQCETVDVRAIFPCFDEPTFKAQFAFEITTAPEAVVLSNAHLVSVTDHASAKTWKFAPTQRMSSYLVALVIGDVASTAEKVINGVPLRVWAMRGKEQMGSFALDYTARLLPWYEEYFGVPYHFDKYDQVAVPGFAAGAMENSGLVLFRQELLIMASGSASWRQEKSIAHVIAHEFAHMWFGNLVTMQWWDDLWLNEAFAEWMSYRAISDLSPDYHVWDDFQRGKSYALSADALENTHPIYSSVETPAQAEELFDSITYTKGCAVMRMLENFLGRESFRKGLRTYMQEFAEGNARGADLWRHLQTASQQPVTGLMENWILQDGHPCVTVGIEAVDDQVRLQLHQRRYFSRPHAAQDNQQLWFVPMVIRYGDAAGMHVIKHVLMKANETLPLNVTGELQWCYANADEIGFYRQSPDAALLSKTLAYLDQLMPSEQMGLLTDQWALTRSGDQNIALFLEVLTALATQSNHYTLLAQIVERLHSIEQLVEDTGDTKVIEHFREWVAQLFNERFQRLGFEAQPNEANEITQLRVSVINAMTTLAQDPAAIAQARLWAEREAISPQNVDVNLAGTVVTVNAQFGDADTFKKHVDIYIARKANGAPPQEVNRYLYSFPAFRSPDLVAQTLSLLDEGVAPKEALVDIMYGLFYARHAQRAAWKYFKSNWDMIKEMGMGMISLIELAGQLPIDMRDDLVAFGNAHVKGEADMAYAKALETMDLLAEFQARVTGDLVQWLSNVNL